MIIADYRISGGCSWADRNTSGSGSAGAEVGAGARCARTGPSQGCAISRIYAGGTRSNNRSATATATAGTRLSIARLRRTSRTIQSAIGRSRIGAGSRLRSASARRATIAPICPSSIYNRAASASIPRCAGSTSDCHRIAIELNRIVVKIKSFTGKSYGKILTAAVACGICAIATCNGGSALRIGGAPRQSYTTATLSG